MKKKNIFLFLACGLVLASCGGANNASSSNAPTSDNSEQTSVNSEGKSEESTVSQDTSKPTSETSSAQPTSSKEQSSSSQSTPVDEEYYAIKVTVPAGVEYQLDKTRAKPGEEVTLTVTANNGMVIDSVVLNKTTTLTGNNGVYKFTMPDRSASIVVTASISGNIVINGEFNAVLTDDDHDGVYVAKNVKVESKTARMKFSYEIKDKDGVMTPVSSMKLDKNRCFANVSFSNDKDYQLSIGTNATYDFYYDTNDSEYPCYIVRTNVDYLPDSKDTLFNLFDGWSSFIPTCNPPELNGISYKYTSATENYDYNYKLYENNVSYAHVNDLSDPDKPAEYHVYKAVDLTNGTYKVVNTYPKAKGNNENSDWTWKIDPNRSDDKYGQPYAATLDLTDGETSIHTKSINQRDALHNVKVGAHYGAELEYEFYKAYRDDYNQTATINASSWGNLSIQSEKTSTGFQTKVLGQIEFNREGGSTADVTQHDANVHVLTIDFLNNGAIKKLTYTNTYYAKSEWNFTAHTPNNGASGKVTKMEVENSYGAPSKETVPFDTKPYFISEISALNFYNDKTKKEPSDSVSYLSYNDILEVVPLYNGGNKAPLVRNFSYLPTTALDAWQYGVSSYTNEAIVGTNQQGKYIIKGVGETDITFTNGTKNSANVSKTIKVESVVGGTVNGFYQNCNVKGYDSYLCESATKLIGQAGQTCTYWIDGSNNTGCPVEYEIYFRTLNQFGDYEYKTENEYCKILTTGNVLTIDYNTPAALALKKAVELTIKFISPFYKEGFSQTTMTIVINPATGTLAGTTWRAGYTDGLSYSKIEFSNEVTTTGAKKGTITEVIYAEAGVIDYKNVWGFTYTQSGTGKITAKIVSANIQEEGFGNNASNYHLILDGLSEDGLLKVAMYWESSSGEEYSDIFGAVEYIDEWGYEVTSYWGFNKVS